MTTFTPRVFSGMQPTGNLHLGNYLGAMLNWVKMQETHECLYCVVDMHAITLWQEPKELHKAILEVTAAYLTLTTAQKTVALQEQNAARARQELTFTEERYRVGAATFLDVTQARATYERAESDRINAVYDYHKAFAALEGAVGRPLR